MEEERVNIIVRVDTDDKHQLKVLAAEQDITMSQIIRKSIRKFIKDGKQETTY